MQKWVELNKEEIQKEIERHIKNGISRVVNKKYRYHSDSFYISLEEIIAEIEDTHATFHIDMRMKDYIQEIHTNPEILSELAKECFRNNTKVCIKPTEADKPYILIEIHDKIKDNKK